MALTSRIYVPDLGPEPEVEDIYAIHLAYLFTDYIPNAHGDPGTSIVYKSPLFGEISLSIPKHPQLDSDRQLFAHYLWNAAVIAAEGIESASASEEANATRTHGKDYPWQQCTWSSQYWDMNNADVLELGAGTALPSIISHLCGARTLITTDHPSSTSVTTGTIAINISRNTMKSEKRIPSSQTSTSTVSKIELPDNAKVYGYLWGETQFYQCPNTPEAEPTLVPEESKPQTKSFTKIIVADCLWIPSKHSSICKTILDYLVEANESNKASEGAVPCALVIAGFHTGRAITSDFFAIATNSFEHTRSRVHYDSLPISDDDPLTKEVRGHLRIAEIFEVDIDGNRREWMAVRPGEHMDDAKRWCVCAVLVRR